MTHEEDAKDAHIPRAEKNTHRQAGPGKQWGAKHGGLLRESPPANTDHGGSSTSGALPPARLPAFPYEK